MGFKKIIHIIPSFELGGVQTGILYSLQELNKEYDYKVLVIGKIDEEWLKTLPFSVHDYLISTGSSSLLAGWIKGYRLLKKIKPDFIISSLWKSVGLSATYKLLNKNVILCGFFHSASSPHLGSTIFMKIMSFVQDTSVADSFTTKRYLRKFYRIRNTNIVPYIFEFTGKKRCGDFDSDYIKMAYFGRISKRKGVDRSIEFCSLLKKAGKKFVFDIYGDGPIESYKEKLKKYEVEDVVNLKTKLPLHEVNDNMRRYDFLLQLSNHEGMALSVVEAMNTGLVPIVTPVGEIKRYTKDRVNAIWLNAPFDDNLHELVEKVLNVSSDPGKYNHIVSQASGTFLHHKKYIDTLKQVLSSYLKDNS